MSLVRAAAVMLLGVVAGCTSVQQVRPAEYIPAHSPSHVWIATHDTVLFVLQPQVDGDTLRGSDVDGPVAIPLANIHAVRARIAAPDRTTLIVAGLVAVGLYISKFGGLSSGSFAYIPDGDCHCVVDVVGPERK